MDVANAILLCHLDVGRCSIHADDRLYTQCLQTGERCFSDRSTAGKNVARKPHQIVQTRHIRQNFLLSCGRIVPEGGDDKSEQKFVHGAHEGPVLCGICQEDFMLQTLIGVRFVS